MTSTPPIEAIETKRKPMEKARVKPRHLSPVIWQLVVDQFRIRKSSEDVAEELGLPVRTVSDIVALHQLGVGPLAMRPEPMMLRRTA